MADPVFKRILLKLSGESLMGSQDYGTDPERLRAVAASIKAVHDRGVELAQVGVGVVEALGHPGFRFTRDVATIYRSPP